MGCQRRLTTYSYAYIDERPSLLIFSALSSPPFRSAKLRKRRPTCPACGEEGQKAGNIEETDYIAFCGGLLPDFEHTGLKEGASEHRIRAKVRRHLYIYDFY